MQVILKPCDTSEGSSVTVETNDKAVISTLVSSYCALKGVKFTSQYIIYDAQKRPLPSYSTISSLGIVNGQTLLIGKEDTTFTLSRQWPLVVALATLAIGLIGILTISLLYGLTGGKYLYDYGVVMDAGSSKTNTIVYKWKSNKLKGTGYVMQETECYARGGIAKMNPMHLEPVLQCAQNVTSSINPKSLSKTPLYFAATAGMRLLEKTDPKRAKQILSELSLHLNDTHLDVKAIEIITGKDEGIYGWITSNFLKKTLEIPQKVDPWEPTTVGALDMGGASLQISYALSQNETLKKKKEDMKNMTLYGQQHNVFSQSNLCFGRDEATNRYRALLLKYRVNDIVHDPCAPKNYQIKVNTTELFKNFCAQNKDQMQNKIFTFLGTGDPSACQRNVSKLMDVSLCKQLNFHECFNKLIDVPENQKFLAFATYFVTTHFLNLTKSSLEEYESVANSFCSKTIDEVKKIIDNRFGPEYCFNAQYIREVLLNGFGFSNSTWKNIEFSGEISGKEVGWTLGYMIYATNMIPAKAKTPGLISTTGLSVSVVLLVLIIIATAVFLLFTYRNRTAQASMC